MLLSGTKAQNFRVRDYARHKGKKESRQNTVDRIQGKAGDREKQKVSSPQWGEDYGSPVGLRPRDEGEVG